MAPKAKLKPKDPSVPPSLDICYILNLSDELLLLVVQNIDRHGDLPNFRLTCKKLRNISEEQMYHEIKLTLEEENPRNWQFRLRCTPQQIIKIRHLAFLNQCQIPNRFFYTNTIPRKDSERLQRWPLLERAATAVGHELDKSAFFIGSQFNWTIRLGTDQLLSFRWRHAIPLPLHILKTVLINNASSLKKLEVSMIQPPSHEEVISFDLALSQARSLTKLKSLIYRGLSYTEPLPINNPTRGGRFRMLRPIFTRTYPQLEELILLQDHCVSQIGKTPMINGLRAYRDTLCTLDELYFDPADPSSDELLRAVDLNVMNLELGGFYVSTLADPGARMRLNLAQLRELTLTECEGLDKLFTSLRSRSDELRLTSFALRYVEDDDHGEDEHETVLTHLVNFLMSFNGLELLSILWHGDYTPDRSGWQHILSQHSTTLEVYTMDVQSSYVPEYRMGTLLTPIIPLTTVRTWIPAQTSPNVQAEDDGLLAVSSRLKEFSFSLTIPDELNSQYTCLHLLSRYSGLRTAHIRNFPPLRERSEKKLFWRIGNYNVTPTIIEIVNQFAEKIALPFYEVPTDWKSACSTWPGALDYLKTLAAVHAAERDRKLLGGRLTEKPNLRLLIVGDWRYRDQMNITGPRAWDPNAWCTSQEDDDYDEYDVSESEHSDYGLYNDQKYNFNHSFKREWDINLRPIFFEIDWKARKGVDGKYRWKAKAKALPQVTLEGERALNNVRCLEHAWGEQVPF